VSTKPSASLSVSRGGARRALSRRLPFADMAARRQQRLVNLVLLLLSTRQYISAERIRESVEGYEISDEATNPDEAFKRSFERDKAELRELGIPLETGRNSAFDTEDGYRIARKDFELPPISFAADEAAAVALAGRLWSTASLASEARTALLKLRAAGVEITEPEGADALPPLPANEPALPDMLQAVSERRVVQFSHRKPAADAPERRTVEPWGVLSWRGRWYVVGHDRDRREVRSFRLDRITGSVKVLATDAQTQRPDGLDMLELVRGSNAQPGESAIIRVRRDRGIRLRRLAQEAKPSSAAEGWDDLAVEFRDTGWIAALVASSGADAVVLEPRHLIDAVVSLLTAATGAEAGGRR
jgi:proteasome accessory factor B